MKMLSALVLGLLLSASGSASAEVFTPKTLKAASEKHQRELALKKQQAINYQRLMNGTTDRKYFGGWNGPPRLVTGQIHIE